MIEFKLPSLGADMDKGTLLEWRVKPGDAVKKGDVIAVVDTTKAAIDVESWHEGTVLELRASPGEVMPVGTLMAILLEPGETPETVRTRIAAQKVGAATAPAASVTVTPATGVAPPVVPLTARRISPAARKRAAELDVDPDVVTGTGPKGAVTIEDVEKAAATAKAAPAPLAPRDRYAEMRKTIATAMARSKREIPHYYLSEDVPLANTVAWLRAENERRAVTERLLVAALYLKAVALAAKKYPEMNGFCIDGDYRPSTAVHVGVAVSLRQGGLIAPAIHDVEQKSLGELTKSLSDVVQRTRAGSLRASELTDPTITVTNLGEGSVAALYPVINPPQVAIVGVGKVSERPWVMNAQVVTMPAVTVSLAADHRVSDGHRGALFLAAIRDLLQHPSQLDIPSPGQGEG